MSRNGLRSMSIVVAACALIWSAVAYLLVTNTWLWS